MAVKQLDPQHELPLLIARNEVVEELETGDEQLLVGVDDSLPFVLVLGASFAVVASGGDAHAHVDEGEYVLVEQPLCAQVLHPLAVDQHVARDTHKLVQSLQVAEQTRRVARNERPRQALVLGRSGVGRSKAAALQRGDSDLEDLGQRVPELPREAQLFAQLQALARLFERRLDHVPLQHAQRVVADVAGIVEVHTVRREGEAQAREVRLCLRAAGALGALGARLSALLCALPIHGCKQSRAVPFVPQSVLGEQRAVHPHADGRRRAENAVDVVRGQLFVDRVVLRERDVGKGQLL